MKGLKDFLSFGGLQITFLTCQKINLQVVAPPLIGSKVTSATAQINPFKQTLESSEETLVEILN